MKRDGPDFFIGSGGNIDSIPFIVYAALLLAIRLHVSLLMPLVRILVSIELAHVRMRVRLCFGVRWVCCNRYIYLAVGERLRGCVKIKNFGSAS